MRKYKEIPRRKDLMCQCADVPISQCADGAGKVDGKIKRNVIGKGGNEMDILQNSYSNQMELV
jgi:hypothetical protein